MQHKLIDLEQSNVVAIRQPRSALPERQNSVAQLLLDQGEMDPGDYLRAVSIQAREDCNLNEILLSHEFVTPAALDAACSDYWMAANVDLTREPADAGLSEDFCMAQCLKFATIPWRRLPFGVVFVTARPDLFEEFCAALPAHKGHAYKVLGSANQIDDALMKSNQTILANNAETKVCESESCRDWSPRKLGYSMLAVGVCFLTILALAPTIALSVVCVWAILTLVATNGLKLAAAIAQAKSMPKGETEIRQAIPVSIPAKLPRVSILVPLFCEEDIASHLIERLKQLSYPKELLDVCLVVEADDKTTRDTIASTRSPAWVRTIVVPSGKLRTKPRAMNYALDFCRGSIIGIYDAEDAPDPDQIYKVVSRFNECPPDVVCLQGILDYYNARTNWLSRCFAIEYATWFRVVLPGLSKLGFAIPLGGTTLFFRRQALEKLGGWDAHNVTEDADLGIRLARHGYRAELVETTTEEEANCRIIPWIKQRSRWIKGYAVTWAVHMRSPRLLLKQLGWRKFCGFQILFAGSLSQFVLAPVLWSFWLVPMGLAHPFVDLLPKTTIVALAVLFFLAEAMSIAIGVFAVSGSKHRFLRWWVPTLHFYYPLAALASYKGLFELISRPFYWDKTSHGKSAPTQSRHPAANT